MIDVTAEIISDDHQKAHLFQVTKFKHVLQVSVKDDGPGIPADKLKRILDTKSTKPVKGSRGIGLNISKMICQKLNGDLSISSNRHGTDVTFSVTAYKVPRTNVGFWERDAN